MARVPIFKTVTVNGKPQKVIAGYRDNGTNKSSDKTSSNKSSGSSKSGSKGSTSFTYTSVSQTPDNLPKDYKAQTVKANPYTLPSKYKGQTVEANRYNGTYKPGTYSSEYTDQINQSRDKILNWSYDPTQDANYQALAAVYGARGNLAAKNSMADAASLNGGYSSTAGKESVQSGTCFDDPTA